MKFYTTLILAAAVIITATVAILIASVLIHMYYTNAGKMNVKCFTYNMKSLGELTIKARDISLKILKGSPKICVYYQQFCNINVQVSNNTITIRLPITTLPLRALFCQHTYAKVWIPENVQKLTISIEAGSAVVENIHVKYLKVYVNAGAAKLKLKVDNLLTVVNNAGSTYLNITPGNSTRISIVNNMGSIHLHLTTGEALVTVLRNNMGSVGVACQATKGPMIQVVNNMGSVAIDCSK